METLRFQVTSRREFERLRSVDPTTLTDLERAARFLYVQRLAFGGKIAGRTFGVDPRSSAGFNLTRLAPLLEEVHDRLAGVTIENLDWVAFIKRYDRPETLFYLDPPYFGNEADYGAGMFDRSAFEQMAETLAGIAGRFVLSLNDRTEVRSIFSAFQFEEVSLTYQVSDGAPTPARELIIRDRK